MKEKIYSELNRSMELASSDKQLDLTHDAYARNLLFNGKDVDYINATVQEWAKEKGINVFIVTDNGYEIRNASGYVQIDFMSASYLAPTPVQIDKLNQPNTVLFLRNLHKMQDTIYRRWLFDCMRSFIVADESKEKGYTFLNNLLFTVATVSEMSSAELLQMCTCDAKDAFFHVRLDK